MMRKYCLLNSPIGIAIFLILAGITFPSFLLGAFPETIQQLGGNGSVGVKGAGGVGGNGGSGGIRCTATLDNAQPGASGNNGGAGGGGGNGTWILRDMLPTDEVSNNGIILIGGTAGTSGSDGARGQYNGGKGGDGGGLTGTGADGVEPYPDPDSNTQQGGDGASYVLYQFPQGGAGSDGGGGGGGSGGGLLPGDAGGAGGPGGNGRNGIDGTGGNGNNGISGGSVITASSLDIAITLQIGGHGGDGGNGGQGGSGGGGGGGSGYCTVHTTPGGVGIGAYGNNYGSGGTGGAGGAAGAGILALQTNGHLINNAGAVIGEKSSGQLLIEDSSSRLINDGTINNVTVLENHGTYGGSGTISGNFINNSVFQPGDSPGKHTIGGTYTEEARLVIDIAGTDPSVPEYSYVAVGTKKMVTLDPSDSVLTVRFYGSFGEKELNHNDYFDVIQFSPSWIDYSDPNRPVTKYALNGVFSSINDSLASLVLGHWEIVYNKESGYVRLIYKRTIPAPLKGVVKDNCTGEKISGVTVTADNGTSQQTVTTDENGVYIFLALPQGEYDIHAQSTGYFPWGPSSVSVPVSGSGIVLDLDLIPNTPPLLTGHIGSACFGESVLGAIITVENTNPTTPLTQTAISESNGSYEVMCLATGSYQVNVTADDYLSATTTVSIIVEQESVLDFDLLYAGDINVDCSVDLYDSIQALQILTGIALPDVWSGADINGDKQIGLAEAIFILRKLANISD